MLLKTQAYSNPRIWVIWILDIPENQIQVWIVYFQPANFLPSAQYLLLQVKYNVVHCKKIGPL